ncbi:MAG: hypothetical protein JJU31_07820 [Wenzhouxiangella sp.]|nr:hypothetical protein [Wenzhouxiangella sp.]MCH8478212.1 hypothetical protein [Wenzhouxiangella sp.]
MSQELSERNTVTHSASGPANTMTFRPRDRSLQAIGAATNSGRASLIVDTSGQWLWVNPEFDQWTGKVNDPVRFHNHRSEELKLQSGARCPVADDETVVWRPLDELLWASALHASQGLLLDVCQRHDVVELKVWPNFTRLPHTPGMLLLATYLFNQPSSLSLAYRQLKISHEEAFAFYSAASHAGYVRRHSGLDSQPKDRPGRHAEPEIKRDRPQGLWRRMFSRFSRL